MGVEERAHNYETLASLHAWTVDRFDENILGLEFPACTMEIFLGDGAAGRRAITGGSVTLGTELAQFQGAESIILGELPTTTEDIAAYLDEVTRRIGRAEALAAEVAEIGYSHNVSVAVAEQIAVTVELISLKRSLKAAVTFTVALDCAAEHSNVNVPPSIRVLVGTLPEAMLAEVLGDDKPQTISRIIA